MIDPKAVVKQWTKGNVRFCIAKVDLVYNSHYCGYCTFPNRPVREQGYRGFMTYVPVHGGITYAEQEVA